MSDHRPDSDFDDKTASRQDANDDKTSVREDQSDPEKASADSDETVIRSSVKGKGAEKKTDKHEARGAQSRENATILKGSGASNENATILREPGASNENATILREPHPTKENATILRESGSGQSTILRDGSAGDDSTVLRDGVRPGDEDSTIINPGHDDDSTV
ncbi:MAG: hypothetical protein WD558_09095, partial [Pseudomonadales bacterium]